MRAPSTARRLLAALVASLVLAAVPAVASAHVHLVSTSPEGGASLNDAPDEVTLTFDGELDPAASGFTVHGQGGVEVGSGEVDLDVADRNVLRGAVTISEPGVYTVEWTVLGTDGHEITGSFSFGYATDEEIPDTALAASRGVTPLAAVGLLLVALAGAASVRRAVVR